MALSPIDIYKNILPKTNCGECGFPNCFAFASMVVNEKIPVNRCPHLDFRVVEKYQEILEEQYKKGKYVKRDMAGDALEWAKERASSLKIEGLQECIGGDLYNDGEHYFLELLYFNNHIVISEKDISYKNGSPLSKLEQVLIYNHIAQKGSSTASGKWKAIAELPNSVSKIVSMKEGVEVPLLERFDGHTGEFLEAAKSIGGIDVTEKEGLADLTVLFRPLPRIPIMLLFWEQDLEEGFDSKVKLLFDETIGEHLDLESIIFLCEKLRELICEGPFEVGIN